MKFLKEASFAVTICDTEGCILEMNDKSKTTFAKYGNIIGQSLLDCHPEPARGKLLDLLTKQYVNAYTIEKEGIKKLIYQTPWYDNGVFGGYIELSLELPSELPNYIRSPQ